MSHSWVSGMRPEIQCGKPTSTGSFRVCSVYWRRPVNDVLNAVPNARRATPLKVSFASRGRVDSDDDSTLGTRQALIQSTGHEADFLEVKNTGMVKAPLLHV